MLGLVAFTVERIADSGSKAPYSAAAVDAHVQVQIVAPAQAQAAADRLAGPGRLTAPVGIPGVREEVVGQLTFRTPDNAPHDGQYALFVIDNDDHRPVRDIWGAGPRGTDVGQGWDGRFDQLADKYHWLAPLADMDNGDGDPGSAVMFRPDTASPVTFVAPLRAGALPVADPSRQLTIALAFISEGGHVYRATRLAV